MKAKPVEEAPGNNYIVVVFDSCRYDSFVAAQPKNILKLGRLEARWSYASWTAPSHYNLLSGLMPHTSPKQVFASDYYKNDFLKYAERLGIEGVGFKSLIPKLYFPAFLQESLHYRTHAMVSLPVLNPRTILNHGPHVFSDNLKAWSGDHCVDPRLVPGALFSNRAILAEDPGIEDMARTALGAPGVEREVAA